MEKQAIGKIILAQLKTMKKTQGWLAEQCGVSNTAVYKWIHSGQIARENAITVALALKLSVDELLGQSNVASQTDFSLEWVTSTERMLLANFRQSTEIGRDMISITASGAPKNVALAKPSEKPK